MKVILISAVSGLGNVGDVVEVRSGFGRNFLIPSKKAIIFNQNNNKLFDEKRKFFEEENENNIKIANSLKKSVGNQNIIIIENASDDGRLYGSVNSSTIADKINSLVKENILSRSHIMLQNPIKEIGVYESVVSFHPEAEFKIKLVVCRNESEVEAMLKSVKENKKEEEIELDSSKKVKSSKKQAEEAVSQSSNSDAKIE